MSFDVNMNMNSISSYNKIFDANLSATNKNVNDGTNFNDVFNSLNQDEAFNSKEPLKAQITEFVGLDAINAQKIEDVSETSKFANSLGNSLSNGLENLNATQKAAEAATETFAAGGNISVHEVMIASQKSSLSMQMAMQMRNKVIDAYQEFKNLAI